MILCTLTFHQSRIPTKASTAPMLRSQQASHGLVPDMNTGFSLSFSGSWSVALAIMWVVAGAVVRTFRGYFTWKYWYYFPNRVLNQRPSPRRIDGSLPSTDFCGFTLRLRLFHIAGGQRMFSRSKNYSVLNSMAIFSSWIYFYPFRNTGRRD